MILSADKISKSYRNGEQRLEIFNDLSLDAEQGELITIMGPSGAGKSTLLNVLGTLDQPDSGSLIIGGAEVNDLSDQKLAELRNESLGFVFQFHHLLPEFTALENIMIPARINNRLAESENSALELLEYVGLKDRKDHYPSQLSGGERARVAVLRALINEPKLVLADEPTGNLDQENGKRLTDLILRLNQEKDQTFIVSTHNPSVAEIGTRRLELRNGSLFSSDGV